MQEFTFKYQNNKGWQFFIFGLLLGPMTALLSSLFLLDMVSWIFWVTMPLMVLMIVWSIKRFMKISRSTDTITVDDQGFTSKDYGRVLYTDIESIPPYNILQAPPPSMRIRLHNRRRIVWLFNPQSTKSKDDIAAFMAFRELLLVKFMHMATGQPEPDRPSANDPALRKFTPEITKLEQHEYLTSSKKTNRTHTTTSSTHTDHNEEIITQLYQHKKRDYKYVTIPVTAVLGFLIFLGTCGTDFIRNKRDREMSAIRSSIMGLETKYQENVDQAKIAIDQYSRKFGPVYLFTNDPEVALQYLPIMTPSSEVLKDVIGLRRAEDNKKLEKLIAHPDSAKYQMIVHHPGSKQFVTLQRSVFDDDSSHPVLYFSIYDPTHSLFDSTLTPNNPGFRPVQFSSSIPIPESGTLKKKDLSNMDYAAVRSILLRYPDASFFMAAKQQDSISVPQFEKMKEFVAEDLKEHGVPLDKFQVKTFNIY